MNTAFKDGAAGNPFPAAPIIQSPHRSLAYVFERRFPIPGSQKRLDTLLSLCSVSFDRLIRTAPEMLGQG